MRSTNQKSSVLIGLILIFLNSTMLSNINSVSANTYIDAKSSSVSEAYYYQMDIHTSGDSSLQALILTEEVYSKLSSYPPQLSIIDSLGEALPHDIVHFPQVIQQQAKKLNIYPLFQPEYLLAETEKIVLTYNEYEKLSEINSTRSNVSIDKVSGYIIDLGELVVGHNHSLRFGLSNTNTTALLSFNIDQSQNLKDWNRFRSGEVLAQLRHGEMSSQRASVDINGYSKRYLRFNLTTTKPQFIIESAELSYSMKEAKSSVWNNTRELEYDLKEKAFIFDTPRSQIFTKLKIEMPDPPSIFSGNLYSRSNKNTRWTKGEKIRLFNTNKDDVSLLNNEVKLSRLSAGQIKITVNYQSSVIEDNKLKIRLASEPQKLIFFANSNPPYKLNIGNSGAVNGLVSSDSRQLIEMLKQQVGNPSELASLGQTRKIKVIQKMIKKKTDWSKIGLWLILVLGVALMIWMSRNLLGQLDK